ncbi:MAG: diguanylate cyclase [Pseudomonadota bacterium]
MTKRAKSAAPGGLRPASGADGLPAGSDAHALEVVRAMAEGVVLWDAEGRCILANPRAVTLMELTSEDLSPGTARDDLLLAGMATGALTREAYEAAKKGFAGQKPFLYEITTASGRELRAQARPAPAGGFVVTLSDVSEMRVQELIVATAKEKAEKAQAELSEKLDDLKLEKRELEAQRAELERTALVATHASDLVYITSPEGRIEWINRAFAQRTGYNVSDVEGKSPIDLLCGPDTSIEEIYKLRAGFRERQTTRSELQVYAKGGTPFWFKCELIPIFSADGRNTHFISVGRDVTDRRANWVKAEQARLFEARKREESHLLTDFNEWLQSCDTVEEMYEVVKTFLARLLPQCRGSLYVYTDNRDMLDGVCSWNDGPLIRHFDPADCWALRRGRPYAFGENDIAFPCAHVADQYSGEMPERYTCVPITAHGDTVGLLHTDLPVSVADGSRLREDQISEMRELANICAEQISLAIANLKLREQLRDQSIRDVLTGLYNRRFFLDSARREINRSMTSREPISIISFDVDRFKIFNDTQGHDAGDQVLRTISAVMTEMFKGREIPCRFGGEEFIILLPGVGPDDIVARAEALRKAIEKRRVRYGNQMLGVTISSGVATYPTDGEDLQDLIKRADQALYAAKEGGRNKVFAASDVERDDPARGDAMESTERINARVTT